MPHQARTCCSGVIENFGALLCFFPSLLWKRGFYALQAFGSPSEVKWLVCDIRKNSRNTSKPIPFLWNFVHFLYLLLPFLPCFTLSKVGKWRDRLLRRFFPSKVGGRPAWLGDSVSQDGLTQGLELISWCYSLIMWIYMSVYGCIYIYVYVYLVWYIYIYIFTHTYIYIQLYICMYLSSYQWIRKQTPRQSALQVDSGKPPAGAQLFEAGQVVNIRPHEVYLGNKNPWEMAGIAYYYIYNRPH